MTQHEKKENLNTHVRTCKERGPFSSSFAGILASIYTTIFTILFVSIIAYNKTSSSASLIASLIASINSVLCSVFHCQEMFYSLQPDPGKLQIQPDNMMIQLMSLLS